MGPYVARRLLLSIPTLFIVSVLIFGMLRLVPGDVLISLLGEGGRLSEEEQAVARARLGLDRPAIVQYFVWLGGILQGDLGDSLLTGQSVNSMVVRFFPVSLELVLLALFVAVLIALPLGILSAIYVDRWVDNSARLFSVVGISIPDFWLATIVVVVPAIWWGISPPLERISFLDDPIGHAGQFLLPAIVLGYGLSAIYVRVLRTTMLEVLGEAYLVTARSKGLAERVVVTRHALKNAFIPVISLMGTQLGRLLGATVILEVVFGLPGMGKLVFDAIRLRDYTVVQGAVMVFAVAMIVLNLLVDLSYGWLNPRIRYS